VSTEAPRASVVVCTNRGPERLGKCLDALARQCGREAIELIVVDDGAPQPLAELCERYGAKLVVHPANLGLAAARNTGWRAARAPIVAFTDDDCCPHPGWVKALLDAYDDPLVAAVGGEICATGVSGLLRAYYQLRPPIAPLEAELGESSSLSHRLRLYVLANTRGVQKHGRRAVYSLPGANMSARRCVLETVGGFDAGIRFGGEDEDFFYRLRHSLPGAKVMFQPSAVTDHEFSAGLSDLLRRARAYGGGCARNFLKHPAWGPTVFPVPLAVMALVLVGVRRGRFLALASLVPPAAFSRWAREAWRRRDPRLVVLSWLQLLEEAASNLGFMSGVVTHWKDRATLRA